MELIIDNNYVNNQAAFGLIQENSQAKLTKTSSGQRHSAQYNADRISEGRKKERRKRGRRRGREGGRERERFSHLSTLHTKKEMIN